MDHILILGHIIILLVGTWAAVYTYQIRRRFDLPFLKSLFYYIVVFNLSVFVYLIARYAWVNLVRHDPATADPSLEAMLRLVILLLEIGLAYTVVRVVVELQGRRLQAVNRLLVLVMTLLIISHFIGWRLDSARWSMMTSLAIIHACTTVILCSLAVLAVRKHAEMTPSRRKAVLGFAYLMLSGYVPFVASSLLPDPYRTFVSAATQLWLNLVPVVWLQRLFLPSYARLSSNDEGAVLENMVREYNISKREREIMELILEGKSNKEIEGQLFISFNTVKNHIYNLYQKLGVNSRSQLMHLVMKKSNHTAPNH